MMTEIGSPRRQAAVASAPACFKRREEFATPPPALRMHAREFAAMHWVAAWKRPGLSLRARCERGLRGLGWHLVAAAGHGALMVKEWWEGFFLAVKRGGRARSALRRGVREAAVRMGRTRATVAQAEAVEHARFAHCWRAGDAPPPGWLGLREVCHAASRAFHDLAPEGALVVADLGEGVRIEIETLDPIAHDADVVFRVDGRLVPDAQIEREPLRWTLRLPRLGAGVRVLRWAGRPACIRRGLASLGWQVTLLRIEPLAPPLPTGGGDPIVFVHVMKCGGTSVRSVLGGAWPLSAVLDPMHVRETDRSLVDGAAFRAPWAFASNHFGWGFVEAVKASGRTPRAVTILRNPVERLLSLHDFFRENHRIPARLTLAELAARAGAHARHPFQMLSARTDLSPGAAQDALLNLRSCVAVGIHERMEDSLSLLCWKLGLYVPAATPHLNRTGYRRPSAALIEEARRALDLHAKADFELYQAAVERFDADFNAMLGELSGTEGRILDSAGVRLVLHRLSLARIAGESPGDHLCWSAADALAGQGFERREWHVGRFMRWTTEAEAVWHFRMPEGARHWMLRVFLSEVSPPSHVKEARLRVAGHALGTSAGWTPRGPVLSAAFPAGVVGSPVIEVGLAAPRTIFPRDRRPLGVAVVGLTVEPQ